jgi:hypothetical protein
MSSKFFITIISKNLSDHRATFTPGIQLLDSSAGTVVDPSTTSRQPGNEKPSQIIQR